MRTVGPYRLEEILGQGGMGVVYRALDERLGRRVAIKHLRPDISDQPAVRARFQREAKAVAHLSHPAIVQVFDVLEQEDGEWIVMELVDGPTLTELLRTGPLDLARVLDYGQQVARGLAEAHSKEILHRDLKTENIMITSSGHAKILDFGLAKPLWKGSGELTVTIAGQILGTCRAMSPEQARGLELDERSDLFSFGALLYEMSIGEAPFQGSSPIDTLTRVCTHRPPPVVDRDAALPVALANLISQLLEKSSGLRPANAVRVAEQLEHIAWENFDREGAGDATGEGGEPLLHDETDLEPLAAEASRLGSTTPADRRRWWRRVALLACGIFAGAVFLVAAPDLRPWQAGARSPDVGNRLAEGRATGSAEEPYVLYRQGMALLARFDKPGHVDQAIDIFQRLLAQDTSSPAGLAGLARAYWRKHRDTADAAWLDQALQVAERAVVEDQYLAAARISLGLVYSSQRRYDEAKSEFEAALLFDPTNADAYRGLGELHRRQKNYDEAEAAFLNAIDARPEDPELHNLLGDVYYRTARYAEAEASFSHSIDLAPDSVFGYRNQAAVYAKQGRYREASAMLQRALEIKPTASVYTNLGTLLFYQGLYQESIAAFRKALDLPGGSNRYYIWANLGDAYRRAPGQDEPARTAFLRAIQLLQENIDNDPRDTTRRSRLALYLAKRGDAEQALAEVAKLEMAEQDANTLFRLAVTLELCGERTPALDALERALIKGYSSEDVRREPELLELRSDPDYHFLMMKMEVGDKADQAPPPLGSPSSPPTTISGSNP